MECEVKTRKCKDCRETKELNEENFVKRPTENGWRGRCRICHNKNARFKQEMTKSELEVGKKYRDKYKKEKPLETLLKNARGNAKKYYREFNLTLAYLKSLWETQEGKCYYTNRVIEFEVGLENSLSIDRIDSSKGYIIGNVVFCQKKVNVMKNDASIEELLTFCKDVLENERFK